MVEDNASDVQLLFIAVMLRKFPGQKSGLWVYRRQRAVDVDVGQMGTSLDTVSFGCSPLDDFVSAKEITGAATIFQSDIKPSVRAVHYESQKEDKTDHKHM